MQARKPIVFDWSIFNFKLAAYLCNPSTSDYKCQTWYSHERMQRTNPIFFNHQRISRDKKWIKSEWNPFIHNNWAEYLIKSWTGSCYFTNCCSLKSAAIFQFFFSKSQQKLSTNIVNNWRWLLRFKNKSLRRNKKWIFEKKHFEKKKQYFS